MTIFGVGGPTGYNRVSPLMIRPPRAVASPRGPSSVGSGLRELGRQLVGLRTSLSELRTASRTDHPARQPIATRVSSSASLGLVLEATATTFRSSEEVNATPTSFDPFLNTFEGGQSTSEATLAGIYDGSEGDTTLTFKVSKGGILGVDQVKIQIKDGNQTVDTITFDAGYVPGTEQATSIGVTLSLSDGLVKKNETFDVNVSASVGSAVDPDAAFDGTGNDIPNFEPGLSVGAGSFFINDEEIVVDADDTLNSVLDKITASGAGVTASFDTLTESVVLTQDTTGPGSQIVLGADDTGFFDATKLSSGAQVLGDEAEQLAVMDDVARFSGVTAGSLTINDEVIAIDPTTDSLQNVIDRINAAGAGVTAVFDEATQEVELTSTRLGRRIDLEDTSGFLAAVGIAEGTYGRTINTSSVSERAFERPSLVTERLRELASDLNELFSTVFSGSALGDAQSVFSSVREAVGESLEYILGDTSGDHLRSGLGLDFDFENPSGGVLSIDPEDLSHALDQDSEALARFLLGREGSDSRIGLLRRLDRALDQGAARVAVHLGPDADSGLVVNLLG